LKTFAVFFSVLFCAPLLLDAQQNTEKKRFRLLNSDETLRVKSDSGSVEYLRGNVAIEHNNAILNCDSAVMYTNLFNAMGHAKITHGTTVITGDFMTYDKKTATVIGTIVYLTDGNSVLRTNKVDYDTETEIGFFENEGTIVDSARLLESKKGYYYAKSKEFDFIGMVEADAKSYVLRSDSMKYNTQTKTFTFFSNTHIWTENGYLYSDRGWYDSEKDIMFFFENSYILSPRQEIFSDSVYYESVEKKGKLYSNIQIFDTLKKTVAMADFADFDMNIEDFVMKKDPSIITFNNSGDTTYISADVILSLNFTVLNKRPKDTLDTQEINVLQDSVISNGMEMSLNPDSVQNNQEINILHDSVISDKTEMYFDADSMLNGTIDIFPDSARLDKTEILFNSDSVLNKHKINVFPDSARLDKTEISFNSDSIQDSKLIDRDTVDYNTVTDTSSYKELYAFENVKLYRKDFQLRCDSLFFSTVDSIWKTYRSPIVWNGKKMQITSDSMNFVMQNSVLKNAVFNGNAMIVSPEGDPDNAVYYNQLKARNIDVSFKNQKPEVLYAAGNAQTIGFSLSDFTMNKAEAASLKMVFDTLGKMRRMIYYSSPQVENNPLFLVREDETRLSGFQWEINLRPKSGNDVISRKVRLTEREERESIPKPLFPITDRINKIEESLKPQNETDNTDTVDSQQEDVGVSDSEKEKIIN
jgi:lipopolysaccharide export system protein LptA